MLNESAEEAALRVRFEAAEILRHQRFAQLQDELARRTTSIIAERKLAEVECYKAEKVAELRDPRPQDDHWGILPEMEDLIGGRTRAEVDDSIAVMVAKTRSIVQSATEAMGSQS